MMPPPSGSCRPVLRHRGLKNDNRRHNLGKIDTSKPIAQIEDEIAVIDAGLAKLNSAAA
jgi:hypothetical protein